MFREMLLGIWSLLQLFVLEEGEKLSEIDGLRGRFLLSSIECEDSYK